MIDNFTTTTGPSSYTYAIFVEEATEWCERSENVFNILKNSLLNISYVKCGLPDKGNTKWFEFHILYSDVFQLPVMYFTIYDSETGVPIMFSDWKKGKYQGNNDDGCYDEDDNMLRWCEISKQNHPWTGLVYEYWHWCKFNQLLHTLPNVKNKLTFWWSIVWGMFELDLNDYIKWY